IGIVGMGNIGEAVAKRAKGFDMEILYHNRSRKPHAEETLGAAYASLDELLAQSDFVVVLAPLTPETEGLFQKEQFHTMKKTAFFINAARGPIVDEEALTEALKTGEIAGAGLDVFMKEPIDPDHPLLSLDNVVALPHIASSSTETRLGMMNLCVENILAVLNEDKPKTQVK
ncbi:D-glycerate dehydrogenase, partial [Bacillus haikouensis]|uniref:NAD(P)-dependent oxidoreductase n=1 Tax=Bacillus haikouensis TaxID=1510468 RepID=UPI001FEC8C11